MQFLTHFQYKQGETMKKSIRNFLKRKSKEPRSMDEIKQSYMELSNRSGQVQYQAHILNKELKNLNDQLESVNNEAAVRQELDKQAPAPAPTAVKEEAKNV